MIQGGGTVVHYNPSMTAYPPLHPSNANFIDIRANNGLYVDKTQHFQHLLAVFPPTGATQPDLVNKHQFLVRPRRFGKTLLINTLEAWFQGLPPAPAARLPGGRDTLTGLPDGWRAPDWMWTGLDGSDWHGVHGWHPVVKLDMSRGRGRHARGNRPDPAELSVANGRPVATTAG